VEEEVVVVVVEEEEGFGEQVEVFIQNRTSFQSLNS
jgi:hypothetical protein